MSKLTVSMRTSANRHWYVAAFLFIAAFINLLDATIVNLALPSIKAELFATNTQMQWVLVTYVIAFAAGLLPFGRFGDAFGRRRLFLWGLFGFVGASVICGIAPNIEVLIVMRLLKGFAASIMLPQVLAIVHANFPKEDVGKAIGYFGLVSGLGALAGPLIGGLLISADLFGLGWRIIFLINVPFGVVSFVGVYVLLPRLAEIQIIRPDWIGALCFGLGTITLLYPLMEGRNQEWSLWLLAVFALSALFFAMFWARQHHLAARGSLQLLPVSLLQNTSFLVGITILTLLFVGVAGSVVVLAITLQLGLQLSAANAGIILAAHPLSAAFSSALTGRLGRRYLNERILLSMASLLLGMLLLRAIFAESLPLFVLWVPLGLIGAGVGGATVAMFQSVLKEVESRDAGAGSGAMQAVQQIGIAVGVALSGQIFFEALGQMNDPAQYILALREALWVPIVIYAGLFLVSAHTIIKEKNA